MLTDVQIINIGLSKISSSRVARIAPPVSPLEAFMASNYPHWKRTELAKRRWVFAMEENYSLTMSDVLTNADKPYKYPLPIDCLRPVRGKRTEWIQRGRFIYSAYPELNLSFIKNVDEADFDPLFDEVLSCRVAVESVEYVTQSNTKKDIANSLYEQAVSEAGRCNAFVIGNEDIQETDEEFTWLVGRHG